LAAGFRLPLFSRPRTPTALNSGCLFVDNKQAIE